MVNKRNVYYYQFQRDRKNIRAKLRAKPIYPNQQRQTTMDTIATSHAQQAQQTRPKATPKGNVGSSNLPPFNNNGKPLVAIWSLNTPKTSSQEQNSDTKFDTKASSHRQSNIDTGRQKSPSPRVKTQPLKNWTTSKKGTILCIWRYAFVILPHCVKLRDKMRNYWWWMNEPASLIYARC